MLRLSILRAATTAAFICCSFLIQPCFADDRGTCDRDSGEHAIAACTRLIQRGGMTAKNLATTYSNRGNEYMRVQEFEKAVRDFDQAIDLFKSSVFFSNRGVAHRRLGHEDLSLADYTQAIKLDPRNFLASTNRAVIWFLRKDFDKTIDDFNRAIAVNPKSGFSLNGRGRAFQAKGDLVRALADYDKAIAVEPKYSRTYSSRGDIWRIQGKYDRAVADYTRSIDLDPRDAEPYTSRALAHEAREDYKQAMSDYRAALSLSRYGSQGNYFNDAGSDQAMAKSRLKLLEDSEGQLPAVPNPPRQETKEAIGRKVALVIGNGAYSNVPALANPVNDARLIAKNLKGLGFEVQSWEDLDQDKMRLKVSDFLRSAVTSRLAIVFYAGHGMQIDGKNYLVPIDANFEKEDSGLIGQMVDMDFILTGMDDKVRTNIFILDACRNDPLAEAKARAAAGRSVVIRSGLAAPSGLSAGTTLGAGTLLAFATAPGQVAADGEGENSPFSTALGRHIGSPGLEVQQMLTRVRSEVVAATKSKQVPWSNSSLLGEVYLVEK